MTKLALNCHKQRCRKRRDKGGNVILDLVVREVIGEKYIHFLDLANQTKADTFNLKRATNRLVHRLAKNGEFQNFPIRDQKRAELYGKVPRGYEVDFIIPPAIGGSYSIENLYLVPKDISQLMYALYWKPLFPELKRFLYKKDGKKIGIMMPDIPRVFSQKAFLNFVLPKERDELEKYLIRKKAWRLEALKRVVVKNKKHYLILSLLHRQRPPQNMKYALVEGKRISLLESSKTKQAYLREREQRVRACLKRGDFDGLPVEIREIIETTGRIPSSVDLTCHHVVPRSLGGGNDIRNMCWLDKAFHEKLHQTYINPLVEYCDFLSEEKRKIFIEIPVPQDTTIPHYFLTRKEVLVRAEIPKMPVKKSSSTR